MNTVISPMKRSEKVFKELTLAKYAPRYLQFKDLIEKIEKNSFDTMATLYKLRYQLNDFHNETLEINCGRMEGYVLRDSTEVNTLIHKAFNLMRSTCNRSNVICKKGYSKESVAYCNKCLQFTCKYCYEKSINSGFTGCPKCKIQTNLATEQLKDLGANDSFTLSDIFEYTPAIGSKKW